jgi:hypothetical protein
VLNSLKSVDEKVLIHQCQDSTYFWQLYDTAKKIRNKAKLEICHTNIERTNSELNILQNYVLQGNNLKNIASANIFLKFFQDELLPNIISFDWEFKISKSQNNFHKVNKLMKNLEIEASNHSNIISFFDEEIDILGELGFTKKYYFLEGTFFSIRLDDGQKGKYFVIPYYMLNFSYLLTAFSKCSINQNPPNHDNPLGSKQVSTDNYSSINQLIESSKTHFYNASKVIKSTYLIQI